MSDDEPLEDLPPALIARIESADRPVPMITSRVDREIAAMARAHFSARRRSARPVWAALAASVLVAVLVLQWPGSAPDRDALYADVDGSGRIDIADVLALARQQAPGKRSQAELDAFAYRVVSLEPPGDAS